MRSCKNFFGKMLNCPRLQPGDGRAIGIRLQPKEKFRLWLKPIYTAKKYPGLKAGAIIDFIQHSQFTIHNSQLTLTIHTSQLTLTIHTSQFTLTIHNSHLILMPCHYKPCHMDIISLLHLQHIRTLRKHRYIDSAINSLLLSHQYTSDIKDGIHILSCNSFYVQNLICWHGVNVQCSSCLRVEESADDYFYRKRKGSAAI